jgi:hypothetical protein
MIAPEGESYPERDDAESPTLRCDKAAPGSSRRSFPRFDHRRTPSTTFFVVAPGVIETPMHPTESYAQLAKMHPLGRMGEISDIVGAMLYLESAGFVTGETIHVDGGQSAGH